MGPAVLSAGDDNQVDLASESATVASMGPAVLSAGDSLRIGSGFPAVPGFNGASGIKRWGPRANGLRNLRVELSFNGASGIKRWGRRNDTHEKGVFNVSLQWGQRY